MFSLKLVYFTYKLMDNLKIYKICHDLIDYFTTLTSPKKSYLDPIFRTGGSITFLKYKISKLLLSWIQNLDLFSISYI